MISAKEAKKITEESQQLLRLQDAERISEFLENLSEQIKEKAMNGRTKLRVEFSEGLGRFYSPPEVKNILTESLKFFGFQVDDIRSKSDRVFIVSWD